MPVLTLPQMCSRVVELLQRGDPDTELDDEDSRLSKARVVANIIQAYEYLSMLGREKKRPELLHFLNISMLDDGTGLMDTRFSDYHGHFLGITRRRDSSDNSPSRDEVTAAHKAWENNYSFSETQQFDRQANGNILLIGNSPHQYWRLWYARQTTLHAGTLGAGTATEITLPSAPTYGSIPPKTYYHESDLVQITSGNASGEVAVIVDYVNSTRVATVESLVTPGDDGFSTAPSTATYSILPWFPPDYHELLPLAAARYFTAVPSAFDHEGTFQELLGKFKNWIGQKDKYTRGIVIDSGNVPDGMEPGAWGEIRAFNGQLYP